jgi:hypothetical protein
MRQAILHIGTLKTGSTSIQKALSSRRSELPAQGAFYPRSPGAGAHVMLAYLSPTMQARRGGKGAHAERFVDKVEQFKKRFKIEMENLPAEVTRVILSEEKMSLLKATHEINDLKQILQPYFDEFIVVVYLRSQDSFLASRYAELLRMGTLGGPDNEVATPGRLWHYDYHGLVGRWAEVFGSASMRPRIYERGAKSDFDSINDFLGACALQLDVPADDPVRHRNKSMSFAGQTFMLRMAALMREKLGRNNMDKSLWHEVSVAVSRGVLGQGWLPTRAEAAAFMQRFEAGNEALRQQYFPERETLFADGSARFPETPMRIDDAAVLEAACLAFLESVQRITPRKEKRKAASSGGRRKRRAAAEGIDDEIDNEIDDEGED